MVMGHAEQLVIGSPEMYLAGKNASPLFEGYIYLKEWLPPWSTGGTSAPILRIEIALTYEGQLRLA